MQHSWLPTNPEILPFNSILSFYNIYHYYFLVHECHKEHKKTVITFEANLRKRVKNTNSFSYEWCSASWALGGKHSPLPHSNESLLLPQLFHCFKGKCLALWPFDAVFVLPLRNRRWKRCQSMLLFEWYKNTICFFWKNRKQSSHFTEQERTPMAQPGVEASIQQSSIFSIAINIHLNNMGDSPK